MKLIRFVFDFVKAVNSGSWFSNNTINVTINYGTNQGVHSQE